MKQFQTDAKLSRPNQNVTKSSSGKAGRKSQGEVKYFHLKAIAVWMEYMVQVSEKLANHFKKDMH